METCAGANARGPCVDDSSFCARRELKAGAGDLDVRYEAERRDVGPEREEDTAAEGGCDISVIAERGLEKAAGCERPHQVEGDLCPNEGAYGERARVVARERATHERNMPGFLVGLEDFVLRMGWRRHGTHDHGHQNRAKGGQEWGCMRPHGRER